MGEIAEPKKMCSKGDNTCGNDGVSADFPSTIVGASVIWALQNMLTVAVSFVIYLVYPL